MNAAEQIEADVSLGLNFTLENHELPLGGNVLSDYSSVSNLDEAIASQQTLNGNSFAFVRFLLRTILSFCLKMHKLLRNICLKYDLKFKLDHMILLLFQILV